MFYHKVLFVHLIILPLLFNSPSFSMEHQGLLWDLLPPTVRVSSHLSSDDLDDGSSDIGKVMSVVSCSDMPVEIAGPAESSPDPLWIAYISRNFKDVLDQGYLRLAQWKEYNAFNNRRAIKSSIDGQGYAVAKMLSDGLFFFLADHNLKPSYYDYLRAEYIADKLGNGAGAHGYYEERFKIDPTCSPVLEGSREDLNGGISFVPACEFPEHFPPVNFGIMGFSALEQGNEKTALECLKYFYKEKPKLQKRIRASVREVFVRKGLHSSKKFLKGLKASP
ncbi:MAG: hypothetical protein JSR85_03890 [Proteobacteria bacterium]|nr:hypothetical protein [Pseudomonadota bacterium]